MRPALHDFSVVHYQDQIRQPHRRNAVGDDDSRPLTHYPSQSREDFLLGMGIDGRQGIVKHQNGRIQIQRARDRGALLLTTRQRDAALADTRVVAGGKIRDVLVEPGNCRGVVN